MSLLRRCSALLGFAAILAGCGARSPEAPMSPAQPAAAAPAPQLAEKPRRPVDEAVAQMDFWLSLTMPPSDGSEGPIAFEARGFRVTQSEYEAGLSEFLAGRPRTEAEEQAFRAQLEEQFAILAWLRSGAERESPDFRASARRALRAELTEVALRRLANPGPVTEADLRALYDSRIDRYRQPERAQVRMILVATEEEARDIVERLGRGESFGSLAAQRSRDPSRRTYGEIPPFRRGTYNREFEEKAFTLPPGETAMVTTAAGNFVVQKIASLPASTIPFASVREELRRELEAERLAEARRRILDQTAK